MTAIGVGDCCGLDLGDLIVHDGLLVRIIGLSSERYYIEPADVASLDLSCYSHRIGDIIEHQGSLARVTGYSPAWKSLLFDTGPLPSSTASSSSAAPATAPSLPIAAPQDASAPATAPSLPIAAPQDASVRERSPYIKRGPTGWLNKFSVLVEAYKEGRWQTCDELCDSYDRKLQADASNGKHATMTRAFIQAYVNKKWRECSEIVDQNSAAAQAVRQRRQNF